MKTRMLRAAEAETKRSARPRHARSDYAAWLDEHDARQPPTRADRHSQADETAARVVATGGGIQAVIATDLRTLKNVVNLIDPTILRHALDNDVLAHVPPPRRGSE